MDEVHPPKLFISYSWTSEDHKQWVLELATQLVENGVEVILDRWHLLDGQDAHVFMERMVNDPEIKHVALICDRKYVDKANSRDGGVGIEAQIITSSIYASHSQTKFVCVVTETDGDGNPVRPTYYGAKKYIAFLDPSAQSDSFDTLLRWVYGKPLDKPPALGKPPAFLTEDERTIRLATRVPAQRALGSLRNGRHSAAADLRAYFETFIDEIEKFRISSIQDGQNRFAESVEEFLPYRNEMLDVFAAIALYKEDQETRTALHWLFEKLIPFMDRPESLMGAYRDSDWDNFKFLAHELFLYAVATYLKYDKLDATTAMLTDEYYTGESSRNVSDTLHPYTIFFQYVMSTSQGSRDLDGSQHGALLKERNKGQRVDFASLLAADIILFLRSALVLKQMRNWYPITATTLSFVGHPPEMFARCKSKRAFDRLKGVIGIESADQLKAFAAAQDRDPQRQPRWGWDTMGLSMIVNAEKLCTAA